MPESCRYQDGVPTHRAHVNLGDNYFEFDDQGLHFVSQDRGHRNVRTARNVRQFMFLLSVHMAANQALRELIGGVELEGVSQGKWFTRRVRGLLAAAKQDWAPRWYKDRAASDAGESPAR